TPSGHVIVFVHGFGGKAVTTWSHFQSLLSNRPESAGCDLVFYGYDGLHTRAPVSAAGLREALLEISGDTAALPNKTLPRECARASRGRYRQVTLIAHSLGAVIAREAVWQGCRQGDAWAKNATLLLFAPAHSGASLIPLLQQAIPWWPVAALMSLAQIFGYFAAAQDRTPK